MSAIIPEASSQATPPSPSPVVGSGPNGNPSRLYFVDAAARVTVFTHRPALDSPRSAFYFEEGRTQGDSPTLLTFQSAVAGQPWWVVAGNLIGGTLWEHAVNDSLSAAGAFVPVNAAGPGTLSAAPPVSPILAEASTKDPPTAPIPIIP